MMRHLSEKRELRIFTNNLKIFEEPCPPGAELYAIGGRFSRENHNFGGPAAEEALRGIRADLFFFPVRDFPRTEKSMISPKEKPRFAG